MIDNIFKFLRLIKFFTLKMVCLSANLPIKYFVFLSVFRFVCQLTMLFHFRFFCPNNKPKNFFFVFRMACWTRTSSRSPCTWSTSRSTVTTFRPTFPLILSLHRREDSKELRNNAETLEHPLCVRNNIIGNNTFYCLMKEFRIGFDAETILSPLCYTSDNFLQ